MKNGLSLLVLLLSTGSLTIRAQNTGELLGAVTDGTGAVVTGAKVTVTETATGLTRSVNTGSDGFYTVSSLRPTDYKITSRPRAFEPLRKGGSHCRPTRRPPSISSSMWAR
jgi:Carboxypeptidase regulatory-like domain